MGVPANYSTLIASLRTAMGTAVFSRKAASVALGIHRGKVDRIMRYARHAGLNNLVHDASTRSGEWRFTA